ncbi:unnamed protein product [Moneuplotes crassus]|uniref:RING-type E3 ubiquitin transferase n=1 Tax=Euplotes crassus TaxID=5936 RepID=A0AAD1XE72_EUPCR|nr:unnamed protein product [Moneuplotes crassus]
MEKTPGKISEDLQIETEEETKEVSADLKALGFSKSMIGKPKSFTKHTSRCAELTKWIEITVYELYLILEQEQKHHKQIDEEEICPICRCELYDDIMTMKKEEICVQQAEMLKDPTEISVIKFGNCSDHYFHKDCAEMMMGEKNHLKCPICSNIYGVLMGEMPPGVMSWQYYDAGYNSCAGYECSGTWHISYSFPSGRKKDGVRYSGTSRQAFLPDTCEGREVMLLLIKSFNRKLTFIVGDSVTTGRKNVVVWNSVHHKTSLSGGSSSFGYPDSTYFNRVKLELADKGVVLEESDDTSKISREGYLQSM